MADVVDSATRSRMMSSIRGRNTKPELLLRRRLHRAGFRYRLHYALLPGKPDIVLPNRTVALLVHGCFWHRHQNCHWCSTPASNRKFWQVKFARNKERDVEVSVSLREAGWRVATIWECGLRPKFVEETVAKLVGWIKSDNPTFNSDIVRPCGNAERSQSD